MRLFSVILGRGVGSGGRRRCAATPVIQASHPVVLAYLSSGVSQLDVSIGAEKKESWRKMAFFICNRSLLFLRALIGVNFMVERLVSSENTYVREKRNQQQQTRSTMTVIASLVSAEKRKIDNLLRRKIICSERFPACTLDW